MKLIIAGGRDYTFTDQDFERLDSLCADATEVVSGEARGADSWGEIWAKGRSISVKTFNADWKTHGREAGPIRNEELKRNMSVI